MAYCKTTFPDEEYLRTLVDIEADRLRRIKEPIEYLLMLSGGSLNGIGRMFTRADVGWERKTLKIDDLTLTRTGPEWNKVIIGQAEGSPTVMRELMKGDEVSALFKSAYWLDVPILVVSDGDSLRVFDGMHRTMAAIRDGKTEIEAWVVHVPDSKSERSAIEPHVIYDLLWAYKNGFSEDRDGLIAALRYLMCAFNNVETLLKERFNADWMPDERVQEVIQEVLNK